MSHSWPTFLPVCFLSSSLPFPSHHGAALASDPLIVNGGIEKDAEEEAEGLEKTDEENLLEVLEELDGKKGEDVS